MTSEASAGKSVVPGVLLCVALAALATWIAKIPWIEANLHFSPLLIVIILGVILASIVHMPAICLPGVQMAQRPILRWAVAGLGFKLSLIKLWQIGAQALVIVIVATLVGFLVALWLAKLFGLNKKLGLLLGVGGSICGASAVVAADSVVQAEQKDAAISLGVITLWGTVGIFLYPYLVDVFQLNHFSYGVFSGATLHEMAQVVAAGSAEGKDAESVATVVKLARICLLAPMVFYLGWWLKKSEGEAGQAKVALVPWFLVMFVVFATVNTFADELGITQIVKDYVNPVVTFLLTVGMAGVGLQTGFKDLKAAGWRPVLVGLLQWVVMILVVLLAIAVFQVGPPQ